MTKNLAQRISWEEREIQENKKEQQPDTGSLALWYVPPVVSWKDEAIRKIQSFQEYNEDNWDDEGAQAISTSTIHNAIQLLLCLIKNINLPKPNLIPGYKDEIIFFWARRGVELKIIANSTSSYDLNHKNCQTEESNSNPDLTLSACLNLLDPALFHKIV